MARLIDPFAREVDVTLERNGCLHLEHLGPRERAERELTRLVERREGAADRRLREAAITAKCKAMTDRVDAARERIGRRVFAAWDASEIEELVRLTRKLADAMQEPPGGSGDR
jgi:DNA-binding MarR family transcriptional regulator